jgi:hypothetical protein
MANVAGIVGVLATFSMVGCYRPPREAQLVQNFETRRAEFDRLLTMATADRVFPRISAGEVPPRGMSDSRFKEYREVFRDLGIQNGVNWGIPGYPDGFFVLFSTSVPMGATGKLLGYYYSSSAPAPIVSRLPISDSPFEIRRDHGYEAFFRALEGQWYAFYEVIW